MAEIENKEVKINEVKRLHTNLLYIRIAIDYLHPRIDDGIPALRFHANCKNYLEAPIEGNERDVTKLLEIFEQKEYIGIGDYDILRDLVRFDVKIEDIIDETELQIINHGCVATRRDSTGKIISRDSPNHGKFHFTLNDYYVFILHTCNKDVEVILSTDIVVASFSLDTADLI